MILKIVLRILDVIWILIGVFILYWTGFWYYKSLTIGNLGVIATGILFGFGIYALAIYIPITLVIILIYLFLRRRKKKKN